MQPILRSIVDEWITISKRYADEGTIVNWYDWVQAYSFDITANLIFGSPLGFVRTESDVEGFMASSHQTAPFASFILRIPWLVDFIADSPLGPYIMPTATDKRGLGLMIGVCILFLIPSLAKVLSVFSCGTV